MKFENSKYYRPLNPYKIIMPYGVFYFCDKFYLAEIHEGVHLDYAKIKGVMGQVMRFYGEIKKLDLSQTESTRILSTHIYTIRLMKSIIKL